MKNKLRNGLFLIFNLFAISVYSQPLSVNASQLSFGNVFENAPDSVQLTISNTIGRDVTVTGIKFYDIYGSPAFSASSTFFTIADGGSTSIWIKFSPKHNILHNTEMVIENDGLRGYVNVDLVGQGKYSNQYYNATENLTEENLKTAIKTITGVGYNSLGYNVARDSMFMRIDNKKINGQGASQNTLECIYTGREAVGYTSRSDCQTNFSFNTEHTFPQSLFTSLEPMKSDLHHLFPTDDAANNERGDNPFGIVTSPTWNSGGSLSNGIIFEPRDVQKGASARALFYFTLRYQNYSNFLNSQESILRNWHSAYPPTDVDRKRNEDIFSVQNNRNPFVDYPVFVDRITSLSTNSISPIIQTIDLTQDTINYGIVQPGTPVIFNFVIVNYGNSNVTFTNMNVSHATELSFVSGGNDTVISPGESLPVQIQCLVTNTDSIRAFLTFNTDATGNASVTIPVFVNDLVFTSVNEIFSDVIVSPNPAHDHLKIKTKNNSGIIDWRLFDVTGKKISSSSFKQDCEIDLSGITRGIYILQFIGESGNMVKKIIVE
jgi:deoxyribonuclease-1